MARLFFFACADLVVVVAVVHFRPVAAGIMSLYPIDVLIGDVADFERGVLIVKSNGVRGVRFLGGSGLVCICNGNDVRWAGAGIIYAVVHLHAHNSVVREQEAQTIVDLVR